MTSDGLSTLHRLHILFGSLVVLMFIALCAHKWQLDKLCMALGLFEFIMTLAYGWESLVLPVVHFQYQAMLLVVPTFLLSVVVVGEFAPWQTFSFIESFHSPFLNEFVESRRVLLAIFLFSLWTIRLLLSHISVVNINTTLRLDYYGTSNLGEIRQSSIHKSLNLAAVTLFAIVAYFNKSTMQDIFYNIAIFELIMACSYILRNSWVMLMHFLYQSAVFLVLVFVNVAMILHRAYPKMTSDFLTANGLTLLHFFVQRGSLLAVSFLSIAWFVRMMTCHVFLVEVATDARINRKQAGKRQQQATKLV